MSIKDPFDKDDLEHDAKMIAKIGGQAKIGSDDLIVTNYKHVENETKENSSNLLILKVNQIETDTKRKSIESVRMSKHYGWGVLASHKSSEDELGASAVYAGVMFRACGVSYVKTHQKESMFIQIRLWDPRIKSFFQDTTLKARNVFVLGKSFMLSPCVRKVIV
nr:hypothetical protein [Tanacetum cinerariifolium]